MKDRIVRNEFYVGRLFHHEKEQERWLEAKIIGERYKAGEYYDSRSWTVTKFSVRAFKLDAERYSASKARAIFKVTKAAKKLQKRGYELQVIRVRVVHEHLQVGENANALIQLAMLAPDEE